MIYFKCFVFCIILFAKVYSQICVCDLTQNACDVNCCCESDCSENDREVFSYCININANTSNLQCSYSEISYLNGVAVSNIIEQTGLFCIIQDNFENRNFFTDAACIESNSCTDTAAFTYSDAPTTSTDTSVYQIGNPILVAYTASSSTGLFTLSSSGISSACLDYSPVGFYISKTDACSRSISGNNLLNLCSTFLNYASYFQGFQIYSLPLNSSSTINISVTECVVNGSSGICAESSFLNNVCMSAVTSVSYVLNIDSSYSTILSASVSFVLQDIGIADSLMTQEFSVSFQINNQSGSDRAGNPGYVVGRPLLTAVRQNNLQEIIQNDILGIELSVINPFGNGTCASSQSSNRIPLVFGENSRTGCTLTITGTCSELASNIREILDGPTFDAFNGSGSVFVGTFGNSNINNLLDVIPADWVPVLVGTYLTPGDSNSGCSNLALSSKYEILYSNSGSLSNAQAKIVGVRYSYDTSNVFSFTCLNNTCTQTVDIFNSVQFIDISSNPASIERNRPILNARLPADFFYPLFN